MKQSVSLDRLQVLTLPSGIQRVLKKNNFQQRGQKFVFWVSDGGQKYIN